MVSARLIGGPMDGQTVQLDERLASLPWVAFPIIRPPSVMRDSVPTMVVAHYRKSLRACAEGGRVYTFHVWMHEDCKTDPIAHRQKVW